MKDVEWDEFQLELNESEFDCGGNVDRANDEFIDIIKRAAERKIGYVKECKRKNKNKWWSPEIQKARKERRERNRICRALRKRKQRGEIDEEEYMCAWREYQRKQKEVKQLIRRAREQEEKIMIEKIRDSGEDEGRD